VIANSPKLADQMREEYATLGINIDDANIVLSSLELTKFFNTALTMTKDPIKVINYLTGDVQAALNKANQTISDSHLTPQKLTEMVQLLDDGVISTKHVKSLLPLLMTTDEPTQEIIDRLGLKLISDPKVIETYLAPIIKQNEKLIPEYINRPERVTKAIMGQLMKTTQGNVNPDVAMKLIVAAIENELKKISV
jgi:aspartyl-tRNA(Asn)/glutamyl-tRNA(Gln) amidotransferase subunit B